MKTIIKYLVLITTLRLAADNATAQAYSILHSFGVPSNAAGFNPRAPLVQGADGTFYGTTEHSEAGGGAVFKLQPDGTGFAVVKLFTNAVEGAYPYGGLAVSGGMLYGTTFQGGSSDFGTVFKVNTDGSGFAVLKDFALTNGAWPSAGLLLSSNTLYGTTSEGGDVGSFGFEGDGTVFKINTDGSDFVVLHKFTASDGAYYPYADLALSGNTLYGTTSGAGTSNGDTVFKVNTDGTGFAVLHDFNDSDGASPYAGLLLSGDTLYGTTRYGGSYDKGTVFKVNTDGSGFVVLKSFSYSDEGIYPQANLVLVSNILYGTTADFDNTSDGPGTLFRVNTNGSSFAVLHQFTWSGGDGAQPYAGLFLSGNTLYGTTYYGGSSDSGTIFSLSLGPRLVPALLPNGYFHLSFTGFRGDSYSIQASTNLVNWSAVTNFVSATGTNAFTDPAAANFSRRFYRAVTP